jgi:hypothetical protein
MFVCRYICVCICVYLSPLVCLSVRLNKQSVPNSSVFGLARNDRKLLQELLNETVCASESSGIIQLGFFPRIFILKFLRAGKKFFLLRKISSFEREFCLNSGSKV